MNDDLHRILRDRADRAPTPHDAEHTIDLVATRAERRTRRRRNQLAVASGAVVVVAAATVGIAVTDSGTGSGSDPVTQRSVAAGASLGTPQPSPEPKRVALHGKQRALQIKAAELAQQRRALMKLAAEARNAGGSLQSIDPAPEKAEISLSLVPKGFEYLSHDTADTYYGLPGTTPDDYFSDGVVVDVHQFIGDIKNYTLTVKGKPASYGKSDGFTLVRVLYSKHVDIGFQAPPSAHLTKAQALKMAGSLDVRSTKHRTHG